jgi:hypothetical protein
MRRTPGSRPCGRTSVDPAWLSTSNLNRRRSRRRTCQRGGVGEGVAVAPNRNNGHGRRKERRPKSCVYFVEYGAAAKTPDKNLEKRCAAGALLFGMVRPAGLDPTGKRGSEKKVVRQRGKTTPHAGEWSKGWRTRRRWRGTQGRWRTAR